MAEAHGVTPRSLRNWKRYDPVESRARPGRPALTTEVVDEARELVRAELDRQGWSAGERPIWRGLGGAIPLARVRRVLHELKAEHRQRRARHIEAERVTTEVCLRDGIWSLDATHLGRDPSGRAVQAELLREVASTRTIELAVGLPANGQDVVQLLMRAVHLRGVAPLVLLTDNGAAYTSKEVADWCEEWGVLHLFTLPHTPQHNAASEHGMREVKEESGLGQAIVHDIDPLHALLVECTQRLDGNRLRASRGWRTAIEDDRARPSWTSSLDRAALREAATCAIKAALLNSGDGRARRRAIREAILGALERFAVIKRTRGGRS